MLLSAIVFLPSLFALLILLWPNERTLRPLALGLSLIGFAASLMIFGHFDPSTASIQLVERHDWVSRFGISYFLGIDGISIWLVILTTFFLPVVILASWESIKTHLKAFYVSLFVLQTSLLGTFLAFDMILFYVFYELALAPMYFLIGIWGGARRIYATIKFFIFTMVGSVFMLVAIIFMMFLTQQQLGQMSASLLDFYQVSIPFVGASIFCPQSLLFFAFALAFAIKVPIFPLHTWLPDAHVEAPTPGSVILAAVMLKMGTYGLMRMAIPLFPDAAEFWAGLFLAIGVVGIIYGALVAMVQPDIKKLIAYSSVSHMGYVMIGLFALNLTGATGGLYQMLNHGISTGALFLLIGMIYERTHSREIKDYGGLAGVLPVFAVIFFIVTLSSIAVPLTNGFVGEFLILLGAFQASMLVGVLAVTGVVLGAVYMLWMYKRVFFGPRGKLTDEKVAPLADLNWRELTVMAPLVLLIFWMGILPGHFLHWSNTSLEYWAENRRSYELTIHEPVGAPSAIVAEPRVEGNSRWN